MLEDDEYSEFLRFFKWKEDSFYFVVIGNGFKNE